MLRILQIRYPIALLMLLAVSAAGAPGDFPAPSGPHGVGRSIIQAKDDDREEPWTDDPSDKREVTMILWYPAEKGSGEAAPYVASSTGKLPSMLAMAAMRGRRFKIASVTDAPEAKIPTKFPVVLFSPGAGESPFEYASILEDLASHGFVVAGLDHTYEGRGQALADGRLIDATADKQGPKPGNPNEAEAMRAFYLKRVKIRAADVKSALGMLKLTNERGVGRGLKGRLELSRVGVFGHSLGGVAAGQALLDIPQVIAGLNYDGHMNSSPLPPVEGGPFTERAFMHIQDPTLPPSDETLAKWKVTREQNDRDMKRSQAELVNNLSKFKAGGYLVLVDGAQHLDFSDESYLLNKPADAERRQKITKATREYTLAFFEKTLLGKSSPLLDPKTPTTPGIKLEVFE